LFIAGSEYGNFSTASMQFQTMQTTANPAATASTTTTSDQEQAIGTEVCNSRKRPAPG